MRALEPHEPTMSGHCVICGTGLDRTRQHIVIDTGFDFDSPGHPLDGRKYVCQGCVFDIGKVAGFLLPGQLDDAKKYLRQYRFDTEAALDMVRGALKVVNSSLESVPSAPNLDHLESQPHILAAIKTIDAEEKKATDFVTVSEGESF